VIEGNKIVSTNDYKVSLYEMGGEVWPNALRLDRGSVKSLLRLKTNFDSIAVADGWLYFKSETLVTGVRLMPVEHYPLESVLEVFDRVGTGDLETYRLPKNLAEVIDNVSMLAGIGLGELNFDTMISLKTEDGNLIARGVKHDGELEYNIPWHRKLPLGGIIVSPSYLKEILPVSRSFKISPSKSMLLFEAPNFKFMMVAGIPEPTSEEIRLARVARFKKSKQNCLIERGGFMNLEEVKEKIKIVSAIPEDNVKSKEWLMDPEDCFGVAYHGVGLDPKVCDECTIKAELDGRVAPLNVFCKELSPKVVEGTKPKATLQEKLEQLKALRERTV
jgi:hypothetical protein